MLTQFTAIIAPQPGGPEILALVRRPVPAPAPHEVLIQMHAAGVNRPDLLQREGKYPAPSDASDVLGLELAGEIIAVGTKVTRLHVGDRVMALVSGGAYASHCLAHQDLCLAIPAGISMVEAGALPEGLFTVWHNMFERGRLQAGETLLIHGGTSGIGTLAIQMAKAHGARVVVTCGSDAKCAAARGLGADLAVNYKTEDFVQAVKAFTNGQGAHVILDMVGGAYIQKNYEAAAVEGRIVQIAFQQGSRVELDMMRVMLKRLTHTGSTLRSRSIEDKSAMAAALRTHVMPWVESGKVKPVIHQTFPLEAASEAHVMLEGGDVVGKVVLVG